MIARTLGTKLQEKLGASFIVDNKAGAGGTVGAALAKRAAPDGYTIFVSSLGPFVIGPHLLKNLGYDPLKDFDYITVAVQAPNVLAVPANSPHKSVSDVLAFHKANPGKMSFASSGNGSSDHRRSHRSPRKALTASTLARTAHRRAISHQIGFNTSVTKRQLPRGHSA